MRFHEWSVGRSASAIAFAAVVSIVSLPVMPPIAAAAADPGALAPLAGLWTGSGAITLQNGTKERLRCRAQYVVTENATNVQQSLRCDSDNYHFHVNAYVNDNGGSLSGNWTEETRNVSGSISGRASGNALSINVAAGSAFSAHMSVITSGASQSVDLKVKGADISDVNVKMGKSH
jgi:hypothetical protein